jgi:AraC family transcriptional regulator
MTGRNIIAETLGYIDTHLREPLSLGDIAAASGLSPFHFSRLFTAVMGESAISYVRRRRLAQAALRLVREPETRLIDLAFDCGFESQEAFTRAFRRTLGMTPGELKRRGGIDLIEEEERTMTRIELGNRLTLEPGTKKRDAFRVAGLSGRFDRTSKAAIPALWQRLVAHLPVAAQQGDSVAYGICWSANPQEGSFNYMAAVEIAGDASAPTGLEVMDIPAQTYLVFKHALDGGNLHRQMSSAAEEIWSRRLAQSGKRPSGGPDFEYYPADLKPDEPSTVYYWVPVVA